MTNVLNYNRRAATIDQSEVPELVLLLIIIAMDPNSVPALRRHVMVLMDVICTNIGNNEPIVSASNAPPAP
jgi:hypothetical protein